jgi:hypothetical protein
MTSAHAKTKEKAKTLWAKQKEESQKKEANPSLPTSLSVHSIGTAPLS